jgi:hypothetical protein
MFVVGPEMEVSMRYLLCAVLALAACRRAETPREAQRADTTPSPPAPPAAAPSPSQDTAAFARLVGTWEAQGYDSGSTRPQRFTLTWSRAPEGGLTGQVAFKPGEKYRVKIVSISDNNTVVYESEPHRSPTLKTDVVTRTEARVSDDSLTGTYEARATAGEKVLRGRFGATRAR